MFESVLRMIRFTNSNQFVSMFSDKD